MTEMGAPRYSVFVRIECKTEVVRAWMGFGDYPVAADPVDTDGGIYQGVGKIGAVPALRQLVGSVAERITFALDGVDAQTLSLADDRPDEVRDAPVNVGLAFFDEDWQQAGPIAWLWDGVADSPSIDREGQVRSASLSVGSALTDRTRPRFTFYTDADQQRRSPGDRFCERVAGYSVESTVKFPG
ncbi:MAG: hypothetical protein EON89_00860 [Brevundimonas sp.]|nr:MAG: hypothetical protein EON89_00860 [Brevundimonas sp.]